MIIIWRKVRSNTDIYKDNIECEDGTEELGNNNDMTVAHDLDDRLLEALE